MLGGMCGDGFKILPGFIIQQVRIINNSIDDHNSNTSWKDKCYKKGMLFKLEKGAILLNRGL